MAPNRYGNANTMFWLYLSASRLGFKLKWKGCVPNFKKWGINNVELISSVLIGAGTTKTMFLCCAVAQELIYCNRGLRRLPVLQRKVGNIYESNSGIEAKEGPACWYKCSVSGKKTQPRETGCEFNHGPCKLHPQLAPRKCRAASCQVGGGEEICSDWVI